MTVRRAKIASLLLVVGLIAVLTPVCGCGSQKKTTTTTTGSTCPTTAPQNTAPQSQDTAPPTPTSSSKSKQAVEQARAEGKPVLLCFHSLKCAPCIQIEQNINQVMPEYQGKVAFVILDVYDPAEYDFCTENNIQTIPATFFIGKDGSVVNKYVGVQEPDQLKQQLDALL